MKRLLLVAALLGCAGDRPRQGSFGVRDDGSPWCAGDHKEWAVDYPDGKHWVLTCEWSCAAFQGKDQHLTVEFLCSNGGGCALGWPRAGVCD